MMPESATRRKPSSDPLQRKHHGIRKPSIMKPKDWERFKEIVHKLYIQDDKSCEEVSEILCTQHGLDITFVTSPDLHDTF